jgi:hypothetical protein
MDGQATCSSPCLQCDFAPLDDIGPCAAKRVLPEQRQDLAIQVLVGAHPVADLARQHQVSRKFLYQQAEIARQALQPAFQPKAEESKVLFYLPVTRAWLRQLVLALVLIGHCSYRNVVELFADLFDWDISLGTVHNIVHAVVAKARTINQQYDLSGIRIGAHDEIFQAGYPVLVGVDTASTYCYLLSQEEHRDGETWGVRLLELMDRGFRPAATVADGGTGLRAGQELALPTVPCWGDHFHVFRDLEALVGYLENRAYRLLGICEQHHQRRARKQRGERRGRPSRNAPASTAQALRRARAEADTAIALADDVALLVRWLRLDVLGLDGPCTADRYVLYDMVVAELQSRVVACSHRLEPICRMLKNQRENLLAFAHGLDSEWDRLAGEFQVSPALLRRLLAMLRRDERDPGRWIEEVALRQQLRGRFPDVCVAVATVAAETVRASSMVENVNSRLRNYFSLRRHLGSDYLALLQFFLNHRRLMRSERAERVGKTPAELLTGQKHPHWLELLGYRRFQRD